MKFEAYLHVNGKVQVKRFFNESSIDTSSSFVLHYLGTIENTSLEGAQAFFEEKIGINKEKYNLFDDNVVALS